ncbi:fused uroporphyrinogen-III synthase HemD/membrane protein HemX [Burkholderiaceae bacterium DAT-1]|nr:fused uroporphyrinogen-III synthase HemD/membrane protein HemX [Burkholderiaceae bacterium DAT-1]
MTTTLAHCRFIVTRPAGQSDTLSSLLQHAGAEAVLAPMISIAPPDHPETLYDAIDRLREYDLVVFVSPTAIATVADQVEQWPEGVPCAVIGPASRDAAIRMGVDTVISPATQHDSEGLLACPEMQSLEGKRVLLVKGNGGRSLLPDTLQARGAVLDIVEAYQRQRPDIDAASLDALLRPAPDAIIVTSSEAVDNLFELAAPAAQTQLRDSYFVASHPRIADAVRRHGAMRVILSGTGDQAIVESLLACFGKPDTPTQSITPPAHSPSPSLQAEEELTQDLSSHSHLPWAIAAVVLACAAAFGMSAWQIDQADALSRQQALKLSNALQLQTQRTDRTEQSLHQAEARLATLETRNEELLSQQTNLRELYGVLSGSHEAALLADAELTLALASQQLQLTGNVSAALSALYRLDERLAGFDAGALLPVRRAVARDIDTLKRIPYVDLVGLSARIDALAAGVDTLPLVVDARPQEDAPKAREANPQGNWLERTWTQIRQSMGAVVEIRRIDRPDPVLLAPEQALYLREHVKLRLLNARLALLQHDQPSFQQDLVAADTMLRRYFDRQSKPVKNTLAGLSQLMQQRPAVELPTLADSLSALKDARKIAQKNDEKGGRK